MMYNKLKIYIYFTILILLNISIMSYADVIPYDPQIFYIQQFSWIKPLELHARGKIKSVTETEIQINLGRLHGVQLGFIYDIYSSNSKVAQLCISSVFAEYSCGYIFDRLAPIDKNEGFVVFAKKIDDAENISYKNRWYPKLYGVLTFVAENYCLINLTALDGVSVGMKFNIYDNNSNLDGVVEVVEISLNEPSIAKILGKGSRFKVGQKVQNVERTKADWVMNAEKFTKNKDFYEDAIFCYEKAFEIDKEDGSLKRRIAEISSIVAKEYENEGVYDRCLLFWRKAIEGGFKKDEKEYMELCRKIFDIANKALATRRYLLPIKYMECLDRSQEVEEAISQAYYLYSIELEKEGQFDQAHEYQEFAFNLSNRNYFIGEKLIKYYLARKDLDKVEKFVNAIIRIAGDKNSKKFLQQTSEYVAFKRDNIFPSNVMFRNMHGDIVSMDNYDEPLVLLYLWKTEGFNNSIGISNLIEIAEKYKDKSLRIIAANVDIVPPYDVKEIKNKKEVIENFMHRFKNVSFDVFLLHTDIGSLMEFSKIPITIIITRNKNILYMQESYFEKEQVEKIVSMFFNES
ncbi:hypothetical protein HY745_06155 [Candidatus Desantisbacteria bacterium]|nr:hypothetical protein [Candidatus Desantisbacteria bacterium]